MLKKLTLFLFSVVEKYSKTTRFCLICNYVAKIIPALQSRCTRFRFGPLTNESVSNKLHEVCTAEGLQLDDHASKAIVNLSGGDMRKVLNVLESCSLAYKEIPVTKVYEVTGRPSPDTIERIYGVLTNSDFQEAFNTFNDLKTSKSLALEDIIRELHKCVMETNFSEQMKMHLVMRMSEVEYRLAAGANERTQIASIVGCFIEARSGSQ